MKRMVPFLLGSLLALASPCLAQSLDDLNLQLHGYASQGFLYTTNNNIFTTTSPDGSPAWTEAVVNLSAQPESKPAPGETTRTNASMPKPKST